MEFVDYKCLESLLIEGKKMIATEEVVSGITNFASKVPIYFKFPNAKIKSIVLPGNLIYFDDLMNICIKNNLTATDFAKFISTYGNSIDSTDEYFLNRGLTKSKDLIYVGTHQNVGLDIFYSKTRKAFIIISEDESVNNITSDDFISWKDVIQSYKSNKDIIWNSATESTEDYQKIKVNFFNKVWNNVKVSIKKNVNIEEANRQIDMFVKNSAKLSKEIESEFCHACYVTMNMWNDDMYPIKKYSDIKPDSNYSWANLQINYIIATDMYDRKNKCPSGKVGLVICGEWPADPEHGWCFGYHDGKWNHDIREFDNCLDLF